MKRSVVGNMSVDFNDDSNQVMLGFGFFFLIFSGTFRQQETGRELFIIMKCIISPKME